MHVAGENEPSANDTTMQMRTFLRTLVEGMIDHPETMSIEVVSEESGTIFNVCVPQQEIGKLIGKGGRIARSIRTIMMAASMKHKRRFGVNIVYAQRGTA